MISKIKLFLQNYRILKQYTIPRWLISDLNEAPWRKAEKLGFTVFTNGEVSFAMVPVPEKSYLIGETQVTQDVWKAVTGSLPKGKKGHNFPVNNISLEDCLNFIQKLNKLTGETFRLPTKEEWQYAAKGGTLSNNTPYAGSYNASECAWYLKNSGDSIHPVKQKRPNEIGLYDMSGNVFEWTSSEITVHPQSIDPSDTNGIVKQIICGGCYSSDEYYLEPKHFKDWHSTTRYPTVGLRLVLDKV